MIKITGDPYVALDRGKDWIRRGIWPCKWVCCPEAGEPPFVTAYRRRFRLEEEAQIRAHVTADERYELFVDGKRVGRGSERGDARNWFYETYDLGLEAGEHVIVARVWSLGSMAPYAQMSIRPGFLFSPEGEFIELLGTGVAEWEAKALSGYQFTDPFPAWGTGANLIIDGSRFDWDFELGEGGGWKPVKALHDGANGFIRNEYPHIHLLKPATLPPMMEREIRVGTARYAGDVGSEATRSVPVRESESIPAEVEAWNRMLRGEGPVAVPARTNRRVIVDLEQYYCAYPELEVSGGRGGSIRLNWAESLYEQPEGSTKGDRNQIEGKFFVGVGDTFQLDGRYGRKFETLWWHAGRYLELLVQAGEEPVTVESLKLRETRYPLEMTSAFESSDERLARITPIALRALQMCSHETYLDCPYYEQLMYSGDTRLETLVTYAITGDDRLPRKALRMFDVSRGSSGIVESRYPSRVTQVIPPFALWWIGMVYDFSLWRDDPAFVRSLMPGVRAVIDWHLPFINEDGLLEGANGWNFMDWVPAWNWGLPPDADFGISGLLNWHLVMTLTVAAELEESLGEAELSARDRRLAAELARRSLRAFWDERRGLLADNLAKTEFSEHTQCMAILSGLLPEERRGRVAEGLLSDRELSRTTISFTHYLFETYRVLGRMDALFERLRLWFELEERGFKTSFEMPEPTRSDCHGWSAHPIYHYFATVLGIRPASAGFRTVRIEPQLGPLTHAKGRMVHPRGEIEVELRSEAGGLKGRVRLPEGVIGTYSAGGITKPLKPGWQEV